MENKNNYKEEYNPILEEIYQRARDDAEREARLKGVKERVETTNKRAKVLSKMLKKDLVELINGAWPDLEEFKKEKLSWKNLPFLPEDLGFKEHTYNTEERGIVRVYYRGGIVILKLHNGKWKFTIKEEDEIAGTMEFKIPSKYVAYQILKSIGISFDGTESTVPELDIKISDILGEEE
ncbi:MAG: hypothetical protein ACTSQZ_05015 [Candidatus Thorarchaeota archaeon]